MSLTFYDQSINKDNFNISVQVLLESGDLDKYRANLICINN